MLKRFVNKQVCKKSAMAKKIDLTLDELVLTAKKIREADVRRCSVSDILTLLDAGALPLSINNQKISGSENSYHVVVYGDNFFCTETLMPLELFKKYESASYLN